MMGLTQNNDNDNFYPVSIPEVDWHCDCLFSSHRGCSFDCKFCSSKRFNVRFGGDPCVVRRLKGEWTKHSNNEYLRRYILPNKSIFISPYNDIMTIPEDDIRAILGKIYDSLEYWFDRDVIGHKEKSQFKVIMQTKNPQRYFDYLDLIPEGSWLGTTIEGAITKEKYKKYSKAPCPDDRYIAMYRLGQLKKNFDVDYKLFVTIEPTIKAVTSSSKEYEIADLAQLIIWIKSINPDLVFVGCGTGEVTYPEPSRDELIELIEQLKLITTVHVKSNAKRILGDLTLHNWFQEIKKM